jgi:DNA (cytosine-5)-methyltransferase 1
LGRALKEQICQSRFDERLTLAVEKAAFIPEPEPVLPVAEKYLHLVGEHKAHPGTGKGRSYQKQPNKALQRTLVPRAAEL